MLCLTTLISRDGVGTVVSGEVFREQFTVDQRAVNHHGVLHAPAIHIRPDNQYSRAPPPGRRTRSVARFV